MTSNETKTRAYQDRNGSYQLPNDATEHERLNIQALGLANLLGGIPCLTELSNPKRILDVGCGTGIVACWLAKRYPEAEVIGLDISPVPEPSEKPVNVTFLQGDVTDKAWRSSQRSSMAAGSFDFIFSRLLIFGMTDWPGYIATLAALARSGGGRIELQEAEFGVMYDGSNEKIPASQCQFMFDMAEDAKAAAGIELTIAPALSALCWEAGLDAVQEQHFKWPSSPPLPEDEEAAGLLWAIYETNQRDMIKVTIQKISAGRRSPDKIKEMLEQAENIMRNPQPGAYGKFFVVSAQKSAVMD